jgi:hypothetical protein
MCSELLLKPEYYVSSLPPELLPTPPFDCFLLAWVLENQRVDDEEEAILDEAMENLTEAAQRLSAVRNRLWAAGVEDRVNYRDLAHRVHGALAMTEAAYLEAKRRSKQV